MYFYAIQNAIISSLFIKKFGQCGLIKSRNWGVKQSYILEAVKSNKQ